MSETTHTPTGPVGVGVIGAGVISGTYLENLNSFPDTTVLAIGDLFPEAANSRAQQHGVAVSGGVEAVLDNPDVELVVNLTIPAAHAAVAGQVIAAGKHVWNEKPLALDRASARAVLDAADTAGLRVGCAPDTFLGSGLQATRRALDGGLIGDPLSALILLQGPGPESWHPSPEFLFQEGGGPLLDIGPYYLTAMVQFFGPVSDVAAIASKSRETRVIGTGPKAGKEFDVTVPSQMSALARFDSGQSMTAVFSFDSPVPRTLLEITGTEGTLLVPDPNMFGGELTVRKVGADDWEQVQQAPEVSSRGTGVLEMARAIRQGQPHRAQGELAYHVLDVMLSMAESGDSREFVRVESTVEPAEPLPHDWDPHRATL